MTGIILLAAGGSKRYGGPKQIADFRGKTLLRHAAETAVSAGLGPVNVVLGAVDEPCRQALAGMDVNIVSHPGWKDGMGGSIAAGLSPWMEEPLAGVIIQLADQPGVEAHHLRELDAASGGEAPIVASRYEGRLGAPAWFSPESFPELLKLAGDQGARGLIAREPRVRWVDLPAAACDVDTPDDLATAQRNFGENTESGNN